MNTREHSSDPHGTFRQDGILRCNWCGYAVNAETDCKLLRAENARLREALQAMQKACDEWAAEFTLKKRGMNWGVVNDAYCKASAALKKEGK